MNNAASALLALGLILTGPTESQVLFSHDFNDEPLHTYTAEDLRTTWRTSRTGGLKPNAVTIVPDPDPSGSRGNVMRVFYAGNSYGGRNNSGSQWKMKIGAHDELYLAYDVYFEHDAEFVKGGKLPGLQSVGVYSDPGVRPDGTDRWTGSLQWRADGQIVNYMYHANQSRKYGDNVAWNDGPGGQVYFQRGKWHRLEIRYKMNTPGVLDGRVQAWLDGELALDTNKIMYRMPGGEHLDIGTFTFITFYGGGNDSFAPSTDQHIYFDNFVISKQPITH